MGMLSREIPGLEKESCPVLYLNRAAAPCDMAPHKNAGYPARYFKTALAFGLTAIVQAFFLAEKTPGFAYRCVT